MIVTFSGKIGSGKTTLTTELASLLGWPRVSFGNYVRSHAAQLHVEPTRENLQNLGEKLLEENPKQFSDNVLNQVVWRSEGNLIIDGIRHIRVLNLIKELVHPFELVHVHIETKAQTRLERLDLRYSISEIRQMDDHTTELDVKYALSQQADLILEGESTVEFLVKEVLKLLKL